MYLVKPKVTNFLIFGILLFIGITCKKDEYNVIPNANVNLSLSKTEVLSMGISTAILKEGGVHGLIIYKVNETEFKAFDRCCSYYPNDNVAVDLDAHTNIATCPSCKSTFQIAMEGQVTKGPAKYPLKQYQTYYNGTRLTVTN